jgi:hypothetical protein
MEYIDTYQMDINAASQVQAAEECLEQKNIWSSYDTDVSK